MNGTQRNYSGWLQISVDLAQREKLKFLAQNVGLELDVGNNYIEFEYQGRDSNQFVVKFLMAMAKIILDAQGEVRCEMEPEEGDPVFNFYSFKEGQLLLQHGEIKRGITELVTVRWSL